MLIVFVEFIDKLIDYPINCASLDYYDITLPENSAIQPSCGFYFVTGESL